MRKSESDIFPEVAGDIGNRPLWLGLAAIVILGFALFVVLEKRRHKKYAPAINPSMADMSVTAKRIPPLYLPPEDFQFPQENAITPNADPSALPNRLQSPPVRTFRSEVLPIPKTQSSNPYNNTSQAQNADRQVETPRVQTDMGSAIVYDVTSAPSSLSVANSGDGAGTAVSSPESSAAVKATRKIDRSNIVPQGTIIAAVLETALDSTQPGQTRALVSEDVPNFNGQTILIPRGSRLFGTYKGELNPGQRRAQLIWTRLERPDGVKILIDSPSIDRLGRAGIKGEVNTYFFERFAGIFLQSSIDIGAAVASREVSGNSVILAFPQGAREASSSLVGPAPKPTLKVRAGTRVSVFVVRDLDFTGMEASN
jgi:type IV secretion system protein VirB10